MSDTIVLIDGHALVFRAFYGVPPLTTPKGELVNAVHGFTSMLFKVWRELKPRYVIATFDYSSKTFRKPKFPDFKALRGDTSDNIPGVPGIGDKTASKLVVQFGSVEGLYEHLGDLPA